MPTTFLLMRTHAVGCNIPIPFLNLMTTDHTVV